MPATSGVRLADLTTLRVGGPARRVVEAGSESALLAAVRESDARGEPLLLVGGGSNLLVSDAGFDGTVVVVRTRGVAVEVDPCAGAWLTVAAGEPWDDLVRRAVDEGWVGIEALSGIPGLTGATPVQNVGAYGQEVSDTIARVRVWDRHSGRMETHAVADAGFGYRWSRYKAEPDRWVVLEVVFALRLGDLSAPVRYEELARALGVDVGGRAPLGEVRDAVLGLRRAKGMVLDPADHDTWSAGSFFTNPVLTGVAAAALPAAAPRWPQPDGQVKTSAAWLIDHAGFGRGWAIGSGAPAALSSKHVLAVTNRGGATAADLVALARAVRDGVLDRFGVRLEPEPVCVGVRL